MRSGHDQRFIANFFAKGEVNVNFEQHRIELPVARRTDFAKSYNACEGAFRLKSGHGMTELSPKKPKGEGQAGGYYAKIALRQPRVNAGNVSIFAFRRMKRETRLLYAVHITVEGVLGGTEVALRKQLFRASRRKAAGAVPR